MRRARLKSLYDLMRTQHLKDRAALIAADQKRADILVAGSAVLLAMMNALELDYIFVSSRGLRDGLMVDLLQKEYGSYTGGWTEAASRSESIEEFGEKYNYDKAHSQQVSKLAVSLFEQLRDCMVCRTGMSKSFTLRQCCTISACSSRTKSTTSIPII